MGKLYRELKLTYNAATYSIDVPTENERVKRQGFSTIRRAVDGTLYEHIIATNTKKVFRYKYKYCTQEVYDFFADCYDAKLDGYEITLERENDDATFESMTITITLPQFEDENIETVDKIYKGLTVELSEI